jgi:hypothetical protein
VTVGGCGSIGVTQPLVNFAFVARHFKDRKQTNGFAMSWTTKFHIKGYIRFPLTNCKFNHERCKHCHRSTIGLTSNVHKLRTLRSTVCRYLTSIGHRFAIANNQASWQSENPVAAMIYEFTTYTSGDFMVEQGRQSHCPGPQSPPRRGGQENPKKSRSLPWVWTSTVTDYGQPAMPEATSFP